MTQSPMRFNFHAMGSFCELQLCAQSRIDAKKVAQALQVEVARLESKYSRFNESSLLSQINRAAGTEAGTLIDEETEALLDHARNCFESSDGLFDITAGALNSIWDFKKARLPSQAEIDETLERVGFEKISCIDKRLHLPRGMTLDLGGIVKEYAADAAARLARRLGIEGGLVNLGGDFSVIGPQPSNLPWSVAIASGDRGAGIMASVALLDGGLASSGDYERYFEHEGRRYSHILNPKTGWPSAGLRAVSVTANLCTVAGSVATIAMLKDTEAGLIWLDESGLPYVAMNSSGKVFQSGQDTR